MSFKPSQFQTAIYKEVGSGTSSIIVQAVAGSGKTTTILESLNLIPFNKKVLFLAFNKSIANELASRVPSHVKAMTLNSLGHRAVLNASERRIVLESNKTRKILKTMIDAVDYASFGDELIKLISLAKAFGIAPAGTNYQGMLDDLPGNWEKLINRFGVDIRSTNTAHCIEIARDILRQGLMQRSLIDFDDQLYIPVVLNLPMPKYDYVYVDEAQDVSPIQRALLKKVLKKDGRLIAVGDKNQAIYGFRGADPESFDCIAKEFNAKELPLSISYRCPVSVVNYAQQHVENIESSPAAIEGEVCCWSWYDCSEFIPSDLMICRNTAPLISMAFTLIARGIGVNVLGREIGQGLIKLINRIDADSIRDLYHKLEEWKIAEIDRLVASDKVENIELISDKFDSVVAVIDSSGARSIQDLTIEIERLFSEKDNCMTLCTVHKSKGLEADRVFILNPDLMPSAYAVQNWQKQQETNLQYVAITRAKKELIMIQRVNLVTALSKTISESVNERN